MPESSSRIFATQRFRVSKIVGAPRSYVYDWLTDYRNDDGRLSRAKSRPRYRVLRLSPDRILRIRLSDVGARNPDIAVDLIRLTPPSSWHTDQIDEEDLATVDYRVVGMGHRRTRIQLIGIERWITPRYPSRTEYLRHVNEIWDHYVTLIETRYRTGRPARG